MGWSGGSRLFKRVIETMQENVDDDETREAIYIDLIEAFEDADWDTLDECIGIDPVYDQILKDNGWEHLFDEEDNEL